MAEVSVIVPVYNAEEFLARSVGSIQQQIWGDLEIVLVDDGSSDGSLALCQRMAEEDFRIKVIHRENGGAAAARNAGVRAATSDLICFVDADDYIEPDMTKWLLIAYRNAVASGAHHEGDFLVQTGRDEVDESGKHLEDALPIPEKERFDDSHSFLLGLLLYTSDSSYCTKLVPRAQLLEHPFPEGMTGEDFLLHMQMLPDLEGVLIIPHLGYHVVHRDGSVTRQSRTFSRSYIDIVRHADYVEQNTVKTYPDLREAALRFGLYERLDYMLHVPIEDMNEKNAFYEEVHAYLRRNYGAMKQNPYLTRKNKQYLTLLTKVPVLTRKVHRMTMKLRGKYERAD